MKIRIFNICIIYFLFSAFIYSQESISNLNAIKFSLENENDTIEFVKLNKDLNTPKPTIIFCQGSLPIPLIIDLNDGKRMITGISNFDYNKIIDKFNLILISMPHIPLIAKEENLNNQYAYIMDEKNVHSYPRAYLNDNYLEKYVERGNAVIEYLFQQKWVDQKKIYIVGHSQGAKIATQIAFENRHIAALGFLSGNPLGRIDQFIREYRLLALKGIISEEDAQEKINKTYQWWTWLNQNTNSSSLNGEDSPKTTISFSRPALSELISLKIPIFIAYGTRDISAAYCDLLPIDFIRARKANYKLVPYLGLEHNYFEVDSIGKPDYNKCHWEQVMNDFTEWLDSI